MGRSRRHFTVAALTGITVAAVGILAWNGSATLAVQTKPSYTVQTEGIPVLTTAPAALMAEDGVVLSAPPDGVSPAVSASEAVSIATGSRGGSALEEALAGVSDDGGPVRLAWAVSLTPLADRFTGGVRLASQGPYTPPPMSGFWVCFVSAENASILFDEGQEWPSGSAVLKSYGRATARR